MDPAAYLAIAIAALRGEPTACAVLADVADERGYPHIRDCYDLRHPRRPRKRRKAARRIAAWLRRHRSLSASRVE